MSAASSLKEDPAAEEDGKKEPTVAEWIQQVKSRHERLSECQESHKKSFQSQWTGVQAYATVYSEIIEESMNEMNRLENFIGGIQTAQQRFSEIMQEQMSRRPPPPSFDKNDGPAKSTMDTQDMPWTEIVELKQQQEASRSTHSSQSSTPQQQQPPNSLANGSHHVAAGSNSEPLRQASNPAATSALSPLLDALEVSQSVWEAKFTSNSHQTAVHVQGPLAIWQPKLQQQADQLAELQKHGFPVIQEKHSRIQKEWESYNAAVQTVLAAASKRGSSLRSMFERSTEPSEMAFWKEVADKPDVWLAEGAYRQAVRDLAKYWAQYGIGTTPMPKRSDSVLGTETTAIIVLLKEIQQTEVERRTEVTEKLQEWVRGQEKLLVGAEAATGLAWLDWEEQNPSETIDSELAKLQRTRQLEEQVVKGLQSKLGSDAEPIHLDEATETLQVMDDIYSVDAYLESPHVVSAAVGEYRLAHSEQSTPNLALVVISSGPQMHFFDLPVGCSLDLESPPQDALHEILFIGACQPTLSLNMGGAVVSPTAVDTIEIVTEDHRLRLLCPHLNNVI